MDDAERYGTVNKHGAGLDMTNAFMGVLGLVFAGCTQPAPAPASSTSAPASTDAGPRPIEPGTSSAAAAPPPSSPPQHAATAPSTSTPGKWTFDADRLDAPPNGFSFGRTGDGHPGRWIVKAEPDAPSGPNVLAQT